MQLSLYLALRRLSRRITRRAERSVAGSVARVTVRSLGSRVLFIGLLPLQPMLPVPTPAPAAAPARPLTTAPVADTVGMQDMQDVMMTARQQRRCPTSSASMDTLRQLTPMCVVPVIRYRAAVAVPQGFVDAGHAE